MSKEMNYRCNDCERGFTNKAAWQHHGAQTGHNIDGDLPGKEQRRVSELEADNRRLANELDLAQRRVGRLENKMTGIISILNL